MSEPNSGRPAPAWDPDLYARRVATYVETNAGTEPEGTLVPRSGIRQFVAMGLDSRFADDAVEAAIERGFVEEVEPDRFGPTEAWTAGGTRGSLTE
ncbi:hypothetical protein ACFQE1_13740 [Halobium palmae]|uniref:Uncharacterized protein n=1 Tax=Halobium palmae TaxID=1776492 RepID=A0ABD5S2H1_9EURY